MRAGDRLLASADCRTAWRSKALDRADARRRSGRWLLGARAAAAAGATCWRRWRLGGGWRAPPRRWPAAGGAGPGAGAAGARPRPARARRRRPAAPDAEARLRGERDVVLAYVLTGDAAGRRDQPRPGLRGLSAGALRAHRDRAGRRRWRSISKRDELSLFPFLYWPVTARASRRPRPRPTPGSTTTCASAA